MPVTCISSKELPKSQQDCSNEPGAPSWARRDQEELADYIEDEITLMLTSCWLLGLGNTMLGDERLVFAGWLVASPALVPEQRV